MSIERTQRTGLAATLTACAACVACVAPAATAFAQFIDPGPKPPPITLPRMRERPLAPAPPAATQGTEAPSFLLFGKDASVGLVPPDRAPGDSGDMLALLVDADAPATRDFPGIMVLTDGQRLPGRMQASGSAPPRWFSPWCAPRPMDTEGVRSITFVATASMPEATDADVVRLRKGDQVSGIVTTIGAESMDLEQGLEQGEGAEKKVRHLPMDTVAAVALAGPPGTRSGTRVWTADGTVLDAPSVQWTNAEYLVLTGVPGARTPFVTLPRRQVLAVQSTPTSATPLASLVPAVSAPAGTAGMRFSTPAPASAPGTWALDAPPLEVEGPVVLAYPSASTPRRLVADVRRPASARAAGSIDLVVSAGGKELARERLDAGRARIPLRVDLPAGGFELQLLPVDGTSAGSFVILERALLLPR